jgi:hypothetical protein
MIQRPAYRHREAWPFAAGPPQALHSRTTDTTEVLGALQPSPLYVSSGPVCDAQNQTPSHLALSFS